MFMMQPCSFIEYPSGPPSRSLGVDPVDPAIMRRPPRKKDQPIINKRLLYRVLFSACVIVIGTLFIYLYALSDDNVSKREQTMVRVSCWSLRSYTNLTVTSRHSQHSYSSISFLLSRTEVLDVVSCRTRCSSRLSLFHSSCSYHLFTYLSCRAFSKQRHWHFGIFLHYWVLGLCQWACTRLGDAMSVH